MTLPLSGPIDLFMICDEFNLPHTSVFPTDFYGKGGVAGTGPLSFEDFYGKSNTATVTVTPTEAFGNGSFSPVTWGNAICNVAGGVGPFTYLWVFDTGNTTVTPDNPTSNQTSFSAALGPGQSKTASYRCQVTDTGNGNQVVLSNAITVTLTRDG